MASILATSFDYYKAEVLNLLAWGPGEWCRPVCRPDWARAQQHPLLSHIGLGSLTLPLRSSTQRSSRALLPHSKFPVGSSAGQMMTPWAAGQGLSTSVMS